MDSRDALMSASAEIHESVDEPAVPAPDVLLSPLVLKRLMGRLFPSAWRHGKPGLIRADNLLFDKRLLSVTS